MGACRYCGDNAGFLRRQHTECRELHRSSLEQMDGLYAPPLSMAQDQNIRGMVESPMMQFLMLSTLNAWALDEENWTTAWNLPVYTRLALIQDVTMCGITLIQNANNTSQSKGWAVTSMLARGVSLAKLTCFSLALGSFSDALSNYRMLLDRQMTLRYLDANDQYEDFAKAYYADSYHRAGKGLNDGELRQGYSREQIERSKQVMDLIRKRYFNNRAPRAPGHYWKPPSSEELAAEYAIGINSEPESVRSKEVLRVYELGNKNVHPQLKDMLQPEDSDIGYQDVTNLVLLTLAGLSEFGLSRFQESSVLTSRVAEIIQQPVHTGTSLLEVILAGGVLNQAAIKGVPKPESTEARRPCR